MKYEDAWPVAVVDEEADPPVVVTRYATVRDAEWFIGYLAENGGDVLRAKVERGGYGPEDVEEIQGILESRPEELESCV